MDFESLMQMRDRLEQARSRVPQEVWDGFERAFEVEFAHNSTAIEGNTLSLVQAKTIIEDGLSVGGKPLREIYEVANHAKAFSYVKKCVARKQSLDEAVMKDIHALLMEGILVGGVYRNVEVRITGAGFKPPVPSEMYNQIKFFFDDLNREHGRNPIERAAWTHAEFVRIHPFADGNGRTARMLMNYQLMVDGFAPVSVSKERRLEYYEALDAYGVNNDLAPFAEMVSDLEHARLAELLAATGRE